MDLVRFIFHSVNLALNSIFIKSIELEVTSGQAHKPLAIPILPPIQSFHFHPWETLITNETIEKLLVYN